MPDLKDVLKPATPSKTSTGYSPRIAVQTFNADRDKRDYLNFKTLELLGLEEELTSRLKWLAYLNRPVIDADKRKLDGVLKELAQSNRSSELPATRAEFLKRNKWLSLYPDEGPLRRELYAKQIELFRLGATSNERLCLASNRSGKTMSASYETTCHATGIYPEWWEGHRFTDPIHIWVCNKGAKETRDINEQELLGPTGNLALRGTGMLPGHRIAKCTPKSGTPNAVEFIDVLHVSGGQSRIQSKSFDQGREAFQGTSIPFIWLDEECPDDVYGECFIRTLDCNGKILMTYTPILGLTPLTTEFLHAAGIEIEGQAITPVQKTA